MSQIRETDLYLPVKAFLESLGYEVKAEVKDADVVALRDGAPPVIVELKTGFSLLLLQQGVARQALSDQVYLAVPRWRGRAGWRMFKGNLGLCRRLGLGVLSVDLATGGVQLHHEPGATRPRRNARKARGLLGEFAAREGDPNLGGSRAGGRVTAYRQAAEKCRLHLSEHGPTKGAAVAQATGVVQATRLMRDNHYGWFTKVSVGIYALTEAGRGAGGGTAE
ncbi:DUF2161 domain-containing phosphodiesterase [Celeribacter indicus]|uniref:Uncharacterized protein n=1 Tax=Celeribacter indicus TaxID=1208324 RepID=A0A0B5DY30_9RHOB|nr:DUF2161 family putative PD-(D/E)XK-type phosphodiesterase [Celeribacter indicus]AJE48348.1 hypothetical protein P73_3633 [Celeribacter indicus]SDW73496.1 hypothetical protein SAMN05443573_106182 [Celeribacter indicus]